jgi:diguanylate cyclase (GGDEF)-like protein
MQKLIADVRNRIDDIVERLNSSDGIVLAVGIIALIAGVLVDVFVWRLICLLVVVGSSMLLYALYHVRTVHDHGTAKGANSHHRSQSETEEMKKLIFDDLQSHRGGRYAVEEVHEPMHHEHGAEDLHAIEETAVSARTGLRGFESISSEAPPVVREFQTSDFFDVDSAIYKEEAEPRAEFDFLLHKVVGALKEVLFAHSVAFFWANREKMQMVLEARATDSVQFVTTRRFSMGHDLVSKVAETGKPEVLTEMNPLTETELVPYYDGPDGIQSFAGVPVYFSRSSDPHAMEQPVGVLVVDSKTPDEFGQETLSLLGQFTKLISALIKSYTDKYDLLLDSELLRSIRRLQERVRNNFSLQTIVQSLAEETSKLVTWDFLSIVLYDEHKRAWVARKITNRAHEAYIVSEQAIDFPDSIVGQAIKHNTHSIVDDLETSSTPRYFSEERIDRRGSFVTVPMSSLNKCYGALNVESRDKYNFSRQNIEILYRLAENAASALEILYTNELIDEYVIIDGLTGVYSKKFFHQKLEEELFRSDDSGSELSLLFVGIDKSADISNRFGQEGFERVMMTLARAIRASVRPYDAVGRYDTDRFGVLLVNTAANDAYLWSEKLRKSIAGHVINLDGKSFSMTISIGLSGALDGMKPEELVGNTTTVFRRASEAGGNTVRVF